MEAAEIQSYEESSFDIKNRYIMPYVRGMIEGNLDLQCPITDYLPLYTEIKPQYTLSDPSSR